MAVGINAGNRPAAFIVSGCRARGSGRVVIRQGDHPVGDPDLLDLALTVYTDTSFLAWVVLAIMPVLSKVTSELAARVSPVF
ncbi:hypothetical protein APED_16280 [Acanthopleuribacter pedis]